MRRLSELRVGDRAVVMGVDGSETVRRRLRAMGFVRGTEVLARQRAPMGDPVAYELMGYCLSLRRSEAAQVLVEPLATLSLAAAPEGRSLRVVALSGGRGARRNLAAAGIGRGTLVHKLAGGDGGPVDVDVDGERRRLGRGVADRIAVVLVEEET